jgi:hypothetical protein
MSDLTNMHILSFPQVNAPSALHGLQHPCNAQAMPIERMLSTFLKEAISEHQPDRIIVIERKGTAILRALKELSGEERLDWPWNKVISSSKIGLLPSEQVQGKRILVFDDMMNRGRHLKILLEELRDCGVWTPGTNDIKVAVFALHENSRDGMEIDGDRVPHYWFYRNLTQNSYHCVRSQIVRMLQSAGSLLLDTEHIEVRVRLHCSFSKFVDVLRRRAKAIVFNSSDNRTNITVLYPDDVAHKLSEHLLPEGTECNEIVKKSRIVERERSEFAIIPICYPSILEPDPTTDWPSDPGVARLLGEDANTPDSRFYGVGLLGALDVLYWVLKDLAVLEDTDYTLLLPTATDELEAKSGYSLDHLHVVYPSLNLAELNMRIADIASDAKSKGKRLRKSGKSLTGPCLCESCELREWAIQLLQIIRHVLDQRIMEMGLYDRTGAFTVHPFGLQAHEIFNIGKELELDDVVISALFDILIDEAFIVTHASKAEVFQNIMRVVRSFEPDGEVVSEHVRRYTMQWGMPNGY